MREASLPFSTPEEAAQVAEAMTAGLSATQPPHLTGMALTCVLAPGYDGDSFACGPDLVLDVLERTAPGPPPGAKHQRG